MGARAFLRECSSGEACRAAKAGAWGGESEARMRSGVDLALGLSPGEVGSKIAQQNCPPLRPKGRTVVSIGRSRSRLRAPRADASKLRAEVAPMQGQFSTEGSRVTAAGGWRVWPSQGDPSALIACAGVCSLHAQPHVQDRLFKT